jgi:hypothetical protein
MCSGGIHLGWFTLFQIPWSRVRCWATIVGRCQWAGLSPAASLATAVPAGQRRSPKAEYAHLVATGQIMEDKGQVEAVRHLQRLFDEVVEAYGSGPRWVRGGGGRARDLPFLATKPSPHANALCPLPLPAPPPSSGPVASACCAFDVSCVCWLCGVCV